MNHFAPCLLLLSLAIAGLLLDYQAGARKNKNRDGHPDASRQTGGTSLSHQRHAKQRFLQTTNKALLWPQVGVNSSICTLANGDIADQESCQTEAISRGKTAYQYSSNPSKCAVCDATSAVRTGTSWPWKIFAQTGESEHEPVDEAEGPESAPEPEPEVEDEAEGQGPAPEPEPASEYKQPLWHQVGEENSICISASQNAVDQHTCQAEAISQGKTAYQYSSSPSKCAVCDATTAVRTGTSWPWKIFAQAEAEGQEPAPEPEPEAEHEAPLWPQVGEGSRICTFAYQNIADQDSCQAEAISRGKTAYQYSNNPSKCAVCDEITAVRTGTSWPWKIFAPPEPEDEPEPAEESESPFWPRVGQDNSICAFKHLDVADQYSCQQEAISQGKVAYSYSSSPNKCAVCDATTVVRTGTSWPWRIFVETPLAPTPPTPVVQRTFESARPGTCCSEAPSSTMLWSEFERTSDAAEKQDNGLPLVVPCGVKVLVDKSPSWPLHGLQVLGDLVFEDGHDIKMETAFVFVCGKFRIGSESHGHESRVEIVLVGDTEVKWEAQDGSSMNFGRKGFVIYGGFTFIRGAACGATSWTRLAKPLQVDTGEAEFAGTREASQSSTGHSRYIANKAVDGAWNWKYSATLTKAEANPWWQVRILATSSGVGLVKVWPRSRNKEFDQEDGAIVGVTDKPCANNDLCGGVSCGRIAESAGSSPKVFDCSGANGSHVYIQLPGSSRQLALEEVQVFAVAEMETRELEVRDAGNAITWKSGDRLMITSTSRSPWETEEVTVEEVDGTHVRFAGKVAFLHEGCLDCVESAEVASMSRNIVIRSEEDCAPNCGHFMIAHTNTGLVCGAEFTNLGQTFKEGRYPLHVHMPGDAPNLTVMDNALHHNHNRGIVMHGVHRMLVKSNLCYRTKGHCFMTEDGVEQSNRILENLGVLPSPQDFGCHQSHDLLFRCPSRSDIHPNAFWISNPFNVLRGNVGIAEGPAFFTETRHVMGLTRRQFMPEAMKVGCRGKIKGCVPFLEFKNNTAHSSKLGVGNYPRFNWFGGSKYEHFTAWRCDLGIAVHNSGDAAALIGGATLFENHAGVSASTNDAHVKLTNTRIKAKDGDSWPVIRKQPGFTVDEFMTIVFAGIDNYTRNWGRCHGGFSAARLSGIFADERYHQPCSEIALSP